MENWFEKLKFEILNFIRTVSDDEMEEAFKKSDYDTYKNINTPIMTKGDKMRYLIVKEEDCSMCEGTGKQVNYGMCMPTVCYFCKGKGKIKETVNLIEALEYLRVQKI